MQYELTLPADYDMSIIRRRVATRGHRTDDFPGLGLKAYLIRERANGSPVNQYAPFYLWHDTGGMSRFLVGGGGFHGTVDDFGRPPVRHWTGIAMERGPGEVPRSATREITAMPDAGAQPGLDLRDGRADDADRDPLRLRRLDRARGGHGDLLSAPQEEPAAKASPVFLKSI